MCFLICANYTYLTENPEGLVVEFSQSDFIEFIKQSMISQWLVHSFTYDSRVAYL